MTRRAPLPARPHISRGFTLIELVLSMSIMTLLVGAMVSAVIVALHALPDPNSPAEQTAAAVDAAEWIAADLATAKTITLADARAVEFTVPDRGHGASGAEAIRYEWSGTPGDPLSRTYNGAKTTVCADVHAFSLTYQLGLAPLDHAPRVLMITDDPPSAEIADKRALLESWGFQVSRIAANASDSAIRALGASADLYYITYEVDNIWLSLLPLLGDAQVWNGRRGYVYELGSAYAGGGIASAYWALDLAGDTITLTKNTHEIVAALPLGAVQVFRSNQDLVQASGTLAPDLCTLATRTGRASLAVLDINTAGINGPVEGRRVKLPWALWPVDIDLLTPQGQMILRRSLVWAAAPVCYARASIVVRCGADVAGEIRIDTQLLNLPRVETP